MRIAYLVNQYPRISLSFIRREIAGVEKAGVQVSRYSIRALQVSNPVRALDTELLDPADKAEALKTKIVLDIGFLGLLGHLIRVAIQRPISWMQCFQCMLNLCAASEISFFHHLAYMAEACVLLHWFNRDEIEHVHVHFGTNPTSVAMLCNILGGPSYSFTIHGPEEFDKPISLSLPVKIERAKFIVAISDFSKSQLCRWCSHEHWHKIHVVHCGLDKSFLDYKSATPIANKTTFVCVARLSEQKGHFLLLEAIKQLADEGYQFKVVLVGDGPLRPALEALVVEWRLEKFIEFAGWASGSTVRERMLEARALVLPSFAEGLPVVIMEALALNRPVISTYIAGIPELLQNGVCGWLIPSGNVNALAKAMTDVICALPSVLEAMGRTGAERVALHHDATIETQKLVKIFQTAIGLQDSAKSLEELNVTPVELALGTVTTQNS